MDKIDDYEGLKNIEVVNYLGKLIKWKLLDKFRECLAVSALLIFNFEIKLV